MTQTTQCGFCRETYEVGDQTYTPDALAAPLNQCAACARQEARGVRERDYPMFEPRALDRASGRAAGAGREHGPGRPLRRDLAARRPGRAA